MIGRTLPTATRWNKCRCRTMVDHSRAEFPRIIVSRLQMRYLLLSSLFAETLSTINTSHGITGSDSVSRNGSTRGGNVSPVSVGWTVSCRPCLSYLLVSETLDDPFNARPGKWSDQDYEKSKVKCIPARHVWKTSDVRPVSVGFACSINTRRLLWRGKRAISHVCRL
jgi:hypothetical protein